MDEVRQLLPCLAQDGASAQQGGSSGMESMGGFKILCRQTLAKVKEMEDLQKSLGFLVESYWFEQEKSKGSVLNVLSLRCRFLCRPVKLDVWRWVLGEFGNTNTKHIDGI